MAVAVFFLLMLISLAAILYPLLPGRMPNLPAPAVDDAEIEREVRRLRQARARGEHACQTCGKVYQAGDRFCVRCGSPLPQADQGGRPRSEAESAATACPSCGATLHQGDQFCAKCGQNLAGREAT